MAPTATTRPIHDLVEEAVERLSSEQLHAMAARRAAAELRAQGQLAPKAPTDWDTCLKVDLNLTVRRLVELHSSFGIDADIASANLLPKLLGAGIPEDDALEALTRACGWRSRTDEDRLEAVARSMLADGFTVEQVRTALRDLELKVAA